MVSYLLQDKEHLVTLIEIVNVYCRHNLEPYECANKYHYFNSGTYLHLQELKFKIEL